MQGGDGGRVVEEQAEGARSETGPSWGKTDPSREETDSSRGETGPSGGETGASGGDKKRALWVAIGYIPALVVVGGPVVWALTAGLEWWSRRADWDLSGRLYGVEAISALAATAIVVAVTWAYLRLADRGTLAGVGLSWRGKAPWGLAAGVAISVLSLTAIFCLDLLLGGSQVRGLNPPSPWLLLLAFATATRAAWTEELINRGVLLDRLERGLSRAAAVVLTTVVFVLPHWSNSAGHGAVRWVGLVLISLTMTAAFYIAGRNLWLPIGLHWATDLWVFVLFGSWRWQGGLLRWQHLAVWPRGMENYFDWLLLAALPFQWMILTGWWLGHRRTAPGAG